jgi:glycosyltransferase involved in cell wall biosynthesis
MFKRQHKLWWQSSYDRGIEHLLNMWPEIKKAYPDATLDVCYGWTTFDSAYANNPERQEWKSKIENLFKQDGITHHGKIGQAEMRELRKTMGIWAYPTHFTEINCIGALECQSDGVVPCVINLAALKETVGSGVKVDGDIYDEETKEEYLKQLLSLMGDEKRWEEESKKGIEFARDYTWDKISLKWDEQFKA